MPQTFRRPCKGYSLVELTVVLTISTLMLVGMMSWLVSLGSVAEAGLHEIGNNEVLLAERQMNEDIVNMATCAGSYDNLSSVRQVSSVTVIVNSRVDDQIRRVSWRYNETSNTLERSALLLDALCAPFGEDEWVTWVKDVESATFAATRQNGTDRTTGGICTQAYARRCMLTGIMTEITLLDDVAGSIVHHTIR